MRIELFEAEKHYAMICGWWKAHEWDVIPLDMLPANGFLVMQGNTPVIAGWLYKSDSKVAWLEWIVANPQVVGGVRQDALDFLISGVKEFATEDEFKYLFMTTENKALAITLRKNKFAMFCDKAMNFMCVLED